MRANFCFDFVIVVKDHDANVRKYHALLGIEPIELARESLPQADMRCTVFPLWNLGDRGMVLSLISSSDAASLLNQRIAQHGEGLALFGIDVDDVDAFVQQGKAAGVKFENEVPMAYDYGRMVYIRPTSTNNVPFFLSTHKPGWWTKTLNAGR
ncbi:MAG: Glyoxalase/Bleomycin resistance protein/Dioxygenase superfamily [Deltaproteobacteria bacterium]|nr:Glyoxalase/Bleomycin resistance protein/Dioxygenase superfamily [Deltaproteobacteria bacterium]